jgi:hypothetical protein
MKGKRAKNEWAPRQECPANPFESLLPEARKNKQCRKDDLLMTQPSWHWVTGRSSGSFQCGAPSRFKPVASCSSPFCETYSSGDCSGFTPDSLFIPAEAGNQSLAAKVGKTIDR